MHRVAYLLAAIVLLAAASPAVAADDPRFGAELVNVPLVVEHDGAPWVGLRNTGDVPIAAVITISGDGWGPARTVTPAIPAGSRYVVPVTTIGTGSANVEAVVTNDQAGMDQARIVLASVARHESPWEALFGWWPLALAALAGMLALARLRPWRWRIVRV